MASFLQIVSSVIVKCLKLVSFILLKVMKYQTERFSEPNGKRSNESGDDSDTAKKNEVVAIKDAEVVEVDHQSDRSSKSMRGRQTKGNVSLFKNLTLKQN